MTELSEGDTLTTEDGTKVWTLTDRRVEYDVRIEPASEDADDDRHTKATYPLVTLLDKLERGSLSVVGETGGSGDGQQETTCSDCGETFKSEQGMKSHRSQVHTESDSESD